MANAKDVKGDLHKVVAGLMGGVSGDGDRHGGRLAAPRLVDGEGREVTGTTKGNSYRGTDFGTGRLGEGDDLLNGKGGSDLLTGGKGRGRCSNSTPRWGGQCRHDEDFSAKDDQIHLSAAIFSGIALGKLAAGAFVTGTSTSNTDDRIIYDRKSGALCTRRRRQPNRFRTHEFQCRKEPRSLRADNLFVF